MRSLTAEIFHYLIYIYIYIYIYVYISIYIYIYIYIYMSAGMVCIILSSIPKNLSSIYMYRWVGVWYGIQKLTQN